MPVDIANALELSVAQEQLPPHHPSHGTPHTMTARTLVVRVDGSTARFEQTDYGHPGRFNAWSPRGIDARLQARTEALLKLCEAASALL